MAQLVERTLGKGEVPSSILGISTSRHYSIKSLNYQNISSDFNYSDFSNYFFKNFNFGLNKPLLHFLSDDRTKTDKNNTKNCDFLCKKESVIQPISSVGELSIIGILFKEQLSLELSPTLKVFLSILTNLCKNSPSYIIDYSNSELFDRAHGLFSLVQIRRHIDRLEKLDLISVTYGQNSSRSIMLTCVNDFTSKFLSVSSLYTESGASKLKASEILVFSYLLDKSSFFAKADLGFFTDNEDAALICEELSISDRTLRNAYASLIELKAISYCSEDSKKAVKAVNISDDISIQYSEKFNITNAALYIKELRASGNAQNIKLAADLERYINNMPPVETSQEELLRKLREFNKKQKEKGYDIKEKIRQRKSHQSKQSQAQKWAINRKKVEK